VARAEQLEAILRAQYELEYAEPEDLPHAWSGSIRCWTRRLPERI